MNERTRRVFGRAVDAAVKVARGTGVALVWTGGVIAGLWVLSNTIKMEEDERAAREARNAAEEAKKPPIVAKFDGYEDTYTESFTTTGPWQISWDGNRDIEI